MFENDFEIIATHAHAPGVLGQLGGVRLKHAGKSIAKPAYHVGPRTILYYSFHFIQEGYLHFQQGPFEGTLHAGDLFCLLPGLTHRYSIANNQVPLKLMFLAFDGEQAGPLVQQLGMSPERPYLEHRLTEPMILKFDAIYRGIQDGASVNDLTMTIEMYELFRILLAPLLSEGKGEYRNSATLVRQCMDYMRQHFEEGLQVKDIVARFSVDRSYFTKIFTKHTGMKPKEYLLQLRMETCRAKLIESDESVTEIARAAGYSDIYVFSRAFKQQYGISPRQYRLRQRIMPRQS